MHMRVDEPRRKKGAFGVDRLGGVVSLSMDMDAGD